MAARKKSPKRSKKKAKAKGKPGRRSLLGSKGPLIIEFVRQGNWFKDACLAAGVSDKTGHRWRKEGEEAQSGEKREFYESLRAAKADLVVTELIPAWKEHFKEDWRSIVEFLQRRYPDDWSKRERLDLALQGAELESVLGRVLSMIKKEVSDPEALRRLAEGFRKMSENPGEEP